MNNIIQIKRRLVGLPGGPALSGGEIAFNEVDKVLYYGANGGGEGNTIGIAGPGLFVDRVTDQTVGGIKTFTNTVSALGDVEVDGNVDANSFSINGTNVINSSREGTFTNIDASGNVTVTGNLTVLGDTTTLETTTYQTSSFNITNAGSETALVVNQEGTTDIAEFKDDGVSALIIKGSVEAPGYIGINTATPNERLTVSGNISAIGNYTGTGDLTIGGTANITGATTLGSSLTVTSVTNLSSNLNVVGAVDIDSTLNVDQAVTLGNNLSVTGTTTLDNNTIYTDGAGSLTITNNLSGTKDSSVIENFIIDCGTF
jgi:hypothetical protein